jgi:PAS domain S-box-containing protein
VKQSEEDRLAALSAFAVLDTPPEQAFDDLTSLAAQLCEKPMALVSLVDADRQWFKSRRGLDLESTPREQSFCAHALRSPEVLEIPDALLDPRFAGNPLVTGHSYLRFYAGAPLVTSDGYVLGTLCVLDTVPGRLNDVQRDQLRILANQVVSQLKVRRQAGELASEVRARMVADAALREQRRMLDGVLNNTDALIYAKDVAGRFVMVNAELERVTRVEGGLVGRTDHELFPAGNADDYRRNDEQIMKTKSGQVFIEVLFHPDGSNHTYRSTKFPLLDDAGAVIGIGGVSTDVTEIAAERAAHQEAEERWHALVENSPSVAVIDVDSRIAYANSEAIALCGAKTRAEVENHPATRFVGSRVERDIRATIMATAAGTALRRAYECVLGRRDGRTITVELDANCGTRRRLRSTTWPKRRVNPRSRCTCPPTATILIRTGMRRWNWPAPWTPSAWIASSLPITWCSARTWTPMAIQRSAEPKADDSRRAPTAIGWNRWSS